MTKPNILIVYTGGTIGMWPSAQGYEPKGGFRQLMRQRLNEVSISALMPFDVLELDTLIDSSNIQLEDWAKLASIIQENYEKYDGFVILHGTDTMAYSASALSFMLQGLDKAVVFTGSQIPLAQPRTDATNNLLNAIEFSRLPDNREVSICFDSLLLRGNRAKKVHSSSLRAFESPNFQPLGIAGIKVNLHQTLPPIRQSNFHIPAFSQQVAQLHLYPGITDTQLDAILTDHQIKGVVMLSYGAGNPPDNNQHLMKRLQEARERGVTIVNLTLCASGSVIQGAYATGAKLNQLGVVPGGDMTVEAAFTKLHFLLATEADATQIRQKMAENLCGELSC